MIKSNYYEKIIDTFQNFLFIKKDQSQKSIKKLNQL